METGRVEILQPAGEASQKTGQILLLNSQTPTEIYKPLCVYSLWKTA